MGHASGVPSGLVHIHELSRPDRHSRCVPTGDNAVSGLFLWSSGIGVMNPSGYVNGGVGAYHNISNSGVFGSDGNIFHKPLPLSIRGK